MSPFTDAAWIWHPGSRGHEPRTVVFRLDFETKAPTTLQLAVTADQRYQLFLDGNRAGLGPERGDTTRWFYERYDLAVEPGAHRLTALCWYLGADEMPGAQKTCHPGFLLAATSSRLQSDLVTTGVAPWKVREVHGVSTVGHSHSVFCGPRYRIDGSAFDYRVVTGEWDEPRSEWVKPVTVEAPVLLTSPSNIYGIAADRLLAPAMLPPPFAQTVRPVRCRWASGRRIGYEPGEVGAPAAGSQLPPQAELDRDARVLIDPELADTDLEALASALATSDRQFTIPAESEYLLLFELDTYYCAYPEISTSGGAGACVELGWAESLFQPGETILLKGDRREVDGKLFIGDFDAFFPGGRDRELFTTPWWRSGRYLLLRVRTADAPLVLRTLLLSETRQPVEPAGAFSSNDPRLEAFLPIGVRSLQMCAHETLMDCPYYEQLQYVGDSRLEALVLYVAGSDDSLARKCILQFDESRLVSGVTRASYPNHETQVIPGFSLHWISMVYDFARYRDNLEFVRGRLPGVRTILDWYAQLVDESGTVGAVPYWNFVDWATDWENGIPPTGPDGDSCINSFEYADALGHAASLEDYAGEPELSALYRRRREAVLAASTERYWDESRGLFADTAQCNRFSEHVQALALTLGVGDEVMHERILDGLLHNGDLSRCTIYYSWYLFEALFSAGRADAVLERLEHWFGHHARGLVTCAETPEPSRSDCHAWGAHPIWHYYASFAGVRPADWEFRRVVVAPRPGPLTSLDAVMPHPMGPITVSYTRDGNHLACDVELPEGLTGELVWSDTRVELAPGKQSYEL